MNHLSRLSLLDREFDAMDEREALALFRSRGFVGAQPRRPNFTVGSWREDAEIEPTPLAAPTRADWIRINPSLAISPSYLETLSDSHVRGNDSWD
jgi:hypothetical protein